LIKRVIIIAVAVIVVLPLLAVGALLLLTPKHRPASQEKVPPDAALIARGDYLFNHVSACVECHSPHDYTRFAGALSGPVGSGGLCITEKDGFPGHVCASNITPDEKVGLGGWTDGEVMRAIREGVRRDGRGLVPVMPYGEYHVMSDEDARALVAYLRTLPKSSAVVSPPSIAFPVNLLMRLAPTPLEGPVQAPPRTDPVKYGEYLASIGGCVGCHTKQDKGKPMPGMRFAGGEEMRGVWGRVVTANITPDDETGIGKMTREQFIGRFQAMAQLPKDMPPPAGANTVMPWRAYGGMSAEDLGALYDYLRTVPKVHNPVIVHPDAQASR
jgi:mono/diheme cytochrome c family protein